MFIWARSLQGFPGPSVGDYQYRARPSGGSFGDARTLPAASGEPVEPAGAANGDVVMAWRERPDPGSFASPGSLLKAAVRPAGSDFGDVQTVYDGGTQNSVCWWTTGISPGGEAIVVFGVDSSPASDSLDCSPHAAVRAPGSARFGAPVQIDDEPAFFRPVVAFDERGNALIAWRGRTTPAVKVARHPAGGGITAPQTVSVPDETSGALIVLRVSEPTGRAVLGFGSTNSDDRLRVAAAIGDTTNGFAAPTVLSGPAALSSAQIGPFFDGAAGADGTLALVWRAAGAGGRAHAGRPSSARGTRA